MTPNIITIPVGSLGELKYPAAERKKHSLITASRLASEKHVDWLIEAVAEARKTVADVTLDIYGEGEERRKLEALAQRLHCESFVRFCGQQDLEEVYKNYEAYLSGSTSEGFGLTLMEAVGSGLPIIGFDVRYGNPTFIDDEQNGYLLPEQETMSGRARIESLAKSIVRLFTEAELEAFHRHSYEKAQAYLTAKVEKQWAKILIQMK